MPKAIIDTQVIDRTSSDNFESIREVLNGGLGIDNFKFQVVEGITSATPDTSKKVQHSMTPQPSFVLPLVGDIYIESISDTFVDVRSTKVSVAFKLICFGGLKLTNEDAIPSDDYKDTLELIEENAPDPVARRSDYFDLNFTPFDGEAISGKYNSVVCTGDYIFVTRHLVNPGQLYRLNIATGVVDRLQLNPNTAVSAMYYDGTDLWVSTLKVNGSTTIPVYQVNPNTFTITTTTVCNVNSSQFTHCANILVTADAIYLAGRRQTGSQAGWLARCSRAGGTQQGQILGSSAGNDGHTGFKKILTNGTDFYAIDGADSSEVRVTRFGGNPISTITTYVSNFNKGYKTMGGCIVSNGDLYIPVVHGSSNGATPSDYGLFSPALVKLDPAGSGTFSVFSLPMGTSNINGGNSEDKSAYFIANALAINDVVYLSGTSLQETRITAFSTINETVQTGILPLGHKLSNFNDTNTGDNESVYIDTVLVDDPNSSSFYVVKQMSGSTSTPVLENFEYFQPVLTDFEV